MDPGAIGPDAFDKWVESGINEDLKREWTVEKLGTLRDKLASREKLDPLETSFLDKVRPRIAQWERGAEPNTQHIRQVVGNLLGHNIFNITLAPPVKPKLEIKPSQDEKAADGLIRQLMELINSTAPLGRKYQELKKKCEAFRPVDPEAIKTKLELMKQLLKQLEERFAQQQLKSTGTKSTETGCA